jgi:dihydroorotate dehydrogenase (NAD+) catalytic subunit
MFKNDLSFRNPLMNAAGMLGFAPDTHAAEHSSSFWGSEMPGAFVTNPLSLRPRLPSSEPALIEYPGGLLLHSGLPNPGLSTAIKKYSRAWAGAQLPVIVHLMADRPEETARMVRSLEGLDNIAAIELGFAPLLTADIILMAVEMSLGELPLIVNLPLEQVLSLGPQIIERGAAALSFAAPRGTLPALAAGPDERHPVVTGRLFGPALFPQSLDLLRSATRLGLPVIGGVGVYSLEQAQVMLDCGAQAVQIDTVLWK